MKMKRPKDWRKGQTCFNFLEWLYGTGKTSNNQSMRMADPFYVSDEDWDNWWEEYQEKIGGAEDENGG